MPSLTHTQTRSVVSTGYQVVDTATASVDMPLEVFVFANDGTYDRIASVLDLQTLPTVVTAGFDYYRVATVQRIFTLLGDAQAFADGAKSMLQALVVDYGQANAAFAGSDTTTLTG